MLNASDDIWGAIAAVTVDGELLIDACPVWNTSQVWSDGQNVEARPEKASDGNTQTSYSSSADADNNSTVIGQGNEYALDNVGAVANKIEVLARGWLNSGKEELADIYVGANKLAITTPTQGSNTQAIWSSFDFTGTIDAANSLRIVDVSTGDYAQRLIAIRIDGEILVDGGSFGANGFHLPFDPAATGANYSSISTGTNYSKCLVSLDMDLLKKHLMDQRIPQHGLWMVEQSVLICQLHSLSGKLKF